MDLIPKGKNSKLKPILNNNKRIALHQNPELLSMQLEAKQNEKIRLRKIMNCKIVWT